MKFDPRTKLLTIAVLTALSVFAPDIAYLGGLLAVTVIFNFVYKVNFLLVFKRLRILISAVVFVSLISSLTVSGEPLWVVNGATVVSVQGLVAGASFFLRMAIIIFAAAMALTSDAKEMTDALIKLKFPYEISFMVSAVLKFLPQMREEFVNRINGVKIRGIDIKKLKINKKFKVYAYVLAPAVVGSALKSRALADAMTARAFRAHNTRTMLRDLKLKFGDFIVIILMLALVAAFITLYMLRIVL
jgi:energy-coupling factor transporter transmembrane protein EcfT